MPQYTVSPAWGFHVILEYKHRIIDPSYNWTPKMSHTEIYFRNMFGTENIPFHELKVMEVSASSYLESASQHGDFFYRYIIADPRNSKDIVSLDTYLRSKSIDPTKVQTEVLSPEDTPLAADDFESRATRTTTKALLRGVFEKRSKVKFDVVKSADPSQIPYFQVTGYIREIGESYVEIVNPSDSSSTYFPLALILPSTIRRMVSSSEYLDALTREIQKYSPQ